jgi:hypothetical protein
MIFVLTIKLIPLNETFVNKMGSLSFVTFKKKVF